MLYTWPVTHVPGIDNNMYIQLDRCIVWMIVVEGTSHTHSVFMIHVKCHMPCNIDEWYVFSQLV